jgi:PAS domain S-box-containing protein
MLADETPLPLWMSDEARAYVYVNPAWLAFTGRTEEEELRDGWTAGIHPEDFGPRQAAFAEAFEAREPFTLEYRLRRHDGQYRWVLDHGAPRFDDEHQHFAGYIGALLDITDRKEAAATRGLFEQRRTSFLASLAHELRNPLAPIRNSVELLQRMRSDDDPRVARAHEIIERNCARLAGLVDDLLDLSRLDSGNVQLAIAPVDVAPLLERALARHASVIRDRNQQAGVVVTSTSLRVQADAERLEQMVGILIGNASQHTPPGGRIEVAARAVGDTIEIAVRDTGVGIDDALRPILFDLFDRGAAGDGRRLGTGLAIVARLARLSGGSVDVESQGKDRGSTFVLRLPAARDQAAHEPGVAPTPGSARHVRLLIVDDNVDAADAIATLLAINDFDVQTAHDPQGAMEAAQAFDPDVILLDIGLPGMTGYELAKKLRADRVARRAKLIALTGYGQPGDTEQAREAGFDGYLVKPVDLEQLRERIDALVGARA